MDVLGRGRRHDSVFLRLSKYSCQVHRVYTACDNDSDAMKRWALVLLGSLFAVAAVATRPDADSHPLTETFVDWMEHPAIRYESGATTDPVAELSRKLQSG